MGGERGGGALPGPLTPPALPPHPGFPGSSRQEAAAEERERLYRQSRSYVEMNQRLQASRERLRQQREELRQAGEALEHGIAEMRQKAC